MNWTRAYLRPEGRGQRLRQRRLADAGDVLDQQVAAREQAGERELQRLGLADDDAVELREDGGETLRDGNIGLAKRADGHEGRVPGGWGATATRTGEATSLVMTGGRRLHSIRRPRCGLSAEPGPSLVPATGR